MSQDVRTGATFRYRNETSGGGAPSGAAGGDLTGTYPNPTIAALAVTGAKMANNTVTATQLSVVATGATTVSPTSITFGNDGRITSTIAGGQCFYAKANATTADGYVPVPFPSVQVNNGFTVAVPGIFTCTVAGNYYVWCRLRTSTDDFFNSFILKNGGTTIVDQMAPFVTSLPDYISVLGGIVSLAVNDTIEIQTEATVPCTFATISCISILRVG